MFWLLKVSENLLIARQVKPSAVAMNTYEITANLVMLPLTMWLKSLSQNYQWSSVRSRSVIITDFDRYKLSHANPQVILFYYTLHE